MRLEEKSYMDAKCYFDVAIDIKNNDKDELLESLIEFYKLHESTKKWHKNDYYEEINFNEGKNVLLDKLTNYYLKVFDLANRIKIIRLNNKSEDELSNVEQILYLKELRLYDQTKLDSVNKSTQLMINPLLQKIMTLSRIASKIKVRVINKKIPNNPENKPIIFVLSHVGRDDQVVFNEAIKEHYTILSGDYENLHNNIESFVTKTNGVIFFDMNSEVERKNVVNKVTDVLKKGDNILCSMEAAWNLSPNEIVRKLFPGMVESAIDANALILPVAIERFNSNLYSICVSDVFFDPCEYFTKHQMDKKSIKDYTEEIRQKLADMKYQSYYDEVIQKQITFERKSIGDFDEANKKFKKDILKGWNFTEEDIKRKGYIDKMSPNQVYAYVLDRLHYYYSRLDQLTTEEYISFMNLLKEELNNPMYPNEIHNQIEEINKKVR